MSWPDEERRTGEPDTGQRRRTADRRGTLRDLERRLDRHEREAIDWRARHDERVEDVEERTDANRQILDGLIASTAGMKGTLDTILALTQGIDGKTDRFASFKALAAYIAAVLLPIILALIGGYVALRSQLPQVVPK